MLAKQMFGTPTTQNETNLIFSIARLLIAFASIVFKFIILTI
jgi:hypothetical protein